MAKEAPVTMPTIMSVGVIDLSAFEIFCSSTFASFSFICSVVGMVAPTRHDSDTYRGLP